MNNDTRRFAGREETDVSAVYCQYALRVEGGDALALDAGLGAAVYGALADGMHHHLVCQECGKVQTIDHEEVSGFFERIEGQHGFQVATNHLVLFGVCEACRGMGEGEG